MLEVILVGDVKWDLIARVNDLIAMFNAMGGRAHTRSA